MSASTVLVCLCGDPKTDHVMGKKACTRCGTCDAFEPDGEAPALAMEPGEAERVAVLEEDAAERAQYEQEAAAEAEPDLAFPVGGIVRDGRVDFVPSGPRPPEFAAGVAHEYVERPGRPTPHLDTVKAELAKVRAEYDEMAKAFDEADVARLNREADLLRVRRERDELLADNNRLVGASQERDDARGRVTLLEAELATARTELEKLRAATWWVVARDTGIDCEECQQAIRRGEAYERLRGVDRHRHVHCPDRPSPRRR